MYLSTLPKGIQPNRACMLLALDDLLGVNGYYDGGREFIIDYMREYKLGYSSQWNKLLEECAPVIVILYAQILHYQGEMYVTIKVEQQRYRVFCKDLAIVCYATTNTEGHAVCTFAQHILTYSDIRTVILKKKNVIVDRV